MYYELLLSKDELCSKETSLRFVFNNRIYQGDVRCNALEFLKYVNMIFEVVILSSSDSGLAGKVIDKLEE